MNYDYNQAHEDLKDYDVRSIRHDGHLYIIVIDSCGRNFDKTLKFNGVSLQLLVMKIKNHFKL